MMEAQLELTVAQERAGERAAKEFEHARRMLADDAIYILQRAQLAIGKRIVALGQQYGIATNTDREYFGKLRTDAIGFVEDVVLTEDFWNDWFLSRVSENGLDSVVASGMMDGIRDELMLAICE